QNAALVEESSAAANSLEEQAQTLEHAVSVFRLGNDDVSTRPAQRASLSASKPLKLTASAAKATTGAKTAVVSRPTANGKDDWESF
ncbi:hypothetical protein NM75_21540, partial [Dickeya fangzhongdai]